MDRLDRLLQARYPDFSRSRIEGLVKGGFVSVNGATATKAGQKVSDEDEIAVEIPPPVPAIPEPEDIPLDIVYEDDDLVVVNKAPGMVVHPAPGHFTGTLVNALLHHLPNLSGIGGVARPGIVHRLDQYTSGLIVVAKSQRAMDSLVRAFSTHRDIEKTYLAVCHRTPRSPTVMSGRIENFIGRHPVDRKRMAIVDPSPHGSAVAGKGGKLAITNWRIVDAVAVCAPVDAVAVCAPVDAMAVCAPVDAVAHRVDKEESHPPLTRRASASTGDGRGKDSASTCLVECRIETGRTHQIRVHMASIGLPIVGDAVYGKRTLDAKLDPVPERQLLHAWRLKIRHPADGRELLFEAPIPADMELRQFQNPSVATVVRVTHAHKSHRCVLVGHEHYGV